MKAVIALVPKDGILIKQETVKVLSDLIKLPVIQIERPPDFKCPMRFTELGEIYLVGLDK